MLSIELNELNKDWIDFYVAHGKLPMFKSIFEENLIKLEIDQNDTNSCSLINKSQFHDV